MKKSKVDCKQVRRKRKGKKKRKKGGLQVEEVKNLTQESPSAVVKARDERVDLSGG